MSQSNVIAGFLTLAFLVFITMKGELPVYMGFLLSDPKPSNPALKTAAANTDAGSGPTVGDVASTAMKFLPLL